MLVGKKHYRTIWLHEQNPEIICIIDQRYLPHRFEIEEITTVDEMATAIRDMHLRGAGLIGAAAAYGIYLSAIEARKFKKSKDFLLKKADMLKSTRPTAINLAWAVDRQLEVIKGLNDMDHIVRMTLQTANDITDEDAEMSRKIGEHGLQIIENISKAKKGDTVQILTHCNAGWLAFVDHGTATSPMYAAFEKGINIHVWVDETRPRNQGASLTAWELGEQGIPHTVIADNTGGHLMQHGLVDLVIVGSDRTTRTGDVANKIGTYLKALAAKDNNIPFYVALPSSSIDWELSDGLAEIPIEERDPDEVRYIQGLHEGSVKEVLLTPEKSNALNYGFDITPACLITGLITERGVCKATEKGILSLFPERNTQTK